MPTIDVERWRGNGSAADPSRTVLVLPGLNYPMGMPLLLLPGMALAERGWTIWHATWDLSDLQGDQSDLQGDQSALLRAVTETAERLHARAGADGTTWLLAKSIGTLAAPWARDAGLPAIWLTPLLTRPGVSDAIASNRAPGLLVGGSADPTWDRTAADGTGKDVLEFAGADHGLYAANWQHYLDTLTAVTRRILDLIAEPLPPSSR